MSTVVLGLTGFPFHRGHHASFHSLRAQGHRVILVPAIGHEEKPWSIKTYPLRKAGCQLAVGSAMCPLEEAALMTRPLPIMAIDVLRLVRAIVLDPKLCREKFGFEPTPASSIIKFAIGPDVKVDKWTGIESIRAEFGDVFLPLPEVSAEETSLTKKGDTIRATVIRRMIANNEPWEHLIPDAAPEYPPDALVNFYKLHRSMFKEG